MAKAETLENGVLLAVTNIWDRPGETIVGLVTISKEDRLVFASGMLLDVT